MKAFGHFRPSMGLAELATFEKAVTLEQTLHARVVSGNWMNKITLTVLTLLFTVISQGQTTLFPPTVDISDYTLSKFMTELTLAVGKKDKKFIIEHMSPKMLNSFGGNGGIEEFKEFWKWGNEEDSKFWKIAERLLILGGSKYIEGSNSYAIPFVYTDWSKLVNNYDAFEHSLIVGTEVNVRDTPNIATSKILGQLNYDIVKRPGNKSYETRDEHQVIEPNFMGGYSWEYICRLDDKLCGFVYWKYVISPIGYRMGFIKKNEKWMIKFLVAGD